jgi:hypothetical protein
MELRNITKVREGLYRVSSKPCPECKEVLTTELPTDKLFLYNQGALIQEVFPNLLRSSRERFVSGYCDDCWSKLFG